MVTGIDKSLPFVSGCLSVWRVLSIDCSSVPLQSGCSNTWLLYYTSSNHPVCWAPGIFFLSFSFQLNNNIVFLVLYPCFFPLNWSSYLKRKSVFRFIYKTDHFRTAVPVTLILFHALAFFLNFNFGVKKSLDVRITSYRNTHCYFHTERSEYLKNIAAVHIDVRKTKRNLQNKPCDLLVDVRIKKRIMSFEWLC